MYRRFHPELVDLSAEPLAAGVSDGSRDPFASNQAIPTLIFFRKRGTGELARRFPQLAVLRRARMAGLSYPASGGFSHAPFLPMALWRMMFTVENWLPEPVFRVFGFRALIVLERRA